MYHLSKKYYFQMYVDAIVKEQIKIHWNLVNSWKSLIEYIVAFCPFVFLKSTNTKRKTIGGISLIQKSRIQNATELFECRHDAQRKCLLEHFGVQIFELACLTGICSENIPKIFKNPKSEAFLIPSISDKR